MTPLLMLLQAAALPIAPPPPPPAPWEPRSRTGTGGVISTSAVVIGKDGLSRLIVKCDRGQEGVVSIQFFAPQPLQEATGDGSFAAKPVALRFDGGAAMQYDWAFRAAAAYISDDAAVTGLTLQLAKAKTIKVETTTAAGFRFEALFNGPGSDAPIRQVLERCGYGLGVGPLPVPVPALARPPAKRPVK